MVVVDVSTCNSFSHFGCNLLFEVDSILTFGRFASCCPFSLPLCLLVSAMKKTVIKIGGGCLFNDVISRRPRGNKLSLWAFSSLFSLEILVFSPFLFRGFRFYFGDVLSFSSPFNRAAFASEDRSHLSPDATSLVSEHSLCLFPWRFRFFPLFRFDSVLAMFWTFRLLQQPLPQLPRARSGGVFFRCNFWSSMRHKKLGRLHSICLPCPFSLLSLFHFFHQCNARARVRFSFELFVSFIDLWQQLNLHSREDQRNRLPDDAIFRLLRHTKSWT